MISTVKNMAKKPILFMLAPLALLPGLAHSSACDDPAITIYSTITTTIDDEDLFGALRFAVDKVNSHALDENSDVRCFIMDMTPISGQTITLDSFYTERFRFNRRIDDAPYEVRINGLSGGDRVTIDADGGPADSAARQKSIFAFSRGVNASLTGVELTGVTNVRDDSEQSGAIRVSGSHVTIVDSIIRDNWAINGGGLYATDEQSSSDYFSCSVTIERTQFRNNKTSFEDLTATDIRSDVGVGGAVYVSDCDLSIDESSFAQNEAERPSILGNSASLFLHGGGAIAITSKITDPGASSRPPHTVTIGNTSFSANKVELANFVNSGIRNDTGGGAIAVWGLNTQSLSLYNVSMNNNLSHGFGGAISIDARGYYNRFGYPPATPANAVFPEVAIDFTTMTNNVASNEGGAILARILREPVVLDPTWLLDNIGTVRVTNTLFDFNDGLNDTDPLWAESANACGGLCPTVRYALQNVFLPDPPFNYNAMVADGVISEINVTQFVNAGVTGEVYGAGQDWQNAVKMVLQPWSLAIDGCTTGSCGQGYPPIIYNVERDLSNKTRNGLIAGFRSDLGADEYHFTGQTGGGGVE